MKSKILWRSLIAFIALAVVAAIAFVFWETYTPPPITLQGEIEARQYMIGSKVPGRLKAVNVKLGDRLAPGDIAFVIDSPEVQETRLQAEALDRIAHSISTAVDKGTRQEEIAVARSEYEKAQAAEHLAENTWRRIKALADEGIVARQRLEEAYTAWQLALKTRVSAGEILKLAEAGARDEVRDITQDATRITQSLVDEVSELLEDSQARAFHRGVVTDVLLQPGELVPQGFPVVMITDVEDAWAVLNVREDLLSHFEEGSTQTLWVPALKRHLDFTVTHVSVLGDYATWRATSADAFDLRTFEVHLRPVAAQPELRAGMSVILEFRT